MSEERGGDKSGVLIATADPAVQGELATRLERAGYPVRVCDNGKDCLGLLDGGGFAVLLVDQRLPGISGIEVIAALRARRNSRECVLMVEGVSDAVVARCAPLQPVTVQAIPYLISHARFIVNEMMERMEDLPKTPSPLRPPSGRPATRERRRHARFEVDEAPGRLRPRSIMALLGFGRTGVECVVADLGEGGARLSSANRLAPGERIRLEIRFERFQEAIEADGEVRWCRERPRSAEKFDTSLSFTGLPPDTARKISAMKRWYDSPECQDQRRVRKETRARLRSSPDAPPPPPD